MSLTWKIELYFGKVLLSVGQQQSLWPAIKTLSPDREKLYSEFNFSDVNHRFRSLDFRDFLEKHLHFLLGIPWTFQNIVKMLLDNIRLYYILS